MRMKGFRKKGVAIFFATALVLQTGNEWIFGSMKVQPF